MRRAQGAMEYMTTYGWAIIAVLVAGTVLWQLGVLSAGENQPVTANGFSFIRPVLANCKMHRFGVSGGSFDGFGCQFLNTHGQPLDIVGLDLKANGQYCAYNMLGDNVFEGIGDIRSQGCINVNDCGNILWPGLDPTFNPYTVPKDGMFTISADNNNGMSFSNPCDNLRPNDFYQLEIDIVYIVDLGGVRTTKRSTGTINLNSD